MPRGLKILLLPVVVLLGLGGFIEVGFDLRQRLEAVISETEFPRDKIRVLFIGDSVLGFLGAEGSLAVATAKRLDQRFPGRFAFRELSAPALRPVQVYSALDDLLNGFEPHIAIMMVGKSDKKLDMVPWDLSSLDLRLVRLLEAVYLDLRQRWLRFMAAGPYSPENIALQSVWSVHINQGCAAGIGKFEEAIRSGIAGDRMYRALHFCYVTTGRYDDGIRFFNEMKESSRYGKLASYFAVVLSEIRGAGSYRGRGGLPLALEGPLGSSDRDLVRTRLWYFRHKGMADEFSKEVANMVPSVSDRLSLTSVQTLKKVMLKLERKSVHVYFLQYPLDHLSELKFSLGGESSDFEYVDLRSWFLEMPDEAKLGFWGDDMEHLSSEGARVLGERLARRIGSRLGLESE